MTTTKQTALGDFVKQYVMERGLTINDLAKKMSVPQSTVARWARGDTTPTIHQLAKLSQATSTDLCDLVQLIIPDARRETASESLAKRIAKLPKDRQEIIDALLVGITLQNTNKQTKQ